jgi:hypothetical protein
MTGDNLPTSADLREEALALREAIVLLRTPPPPQGKTEALHLAWKGIVEPRLGSLTGALDLLADAGAWVLDEEDRAVRLQPDRWDAALDHLAGLYATLADTLARYRALRVEWGAPKLSGARKKAASKRKARSASKDGSVPPLAELAEGINESLEGQRAFLQEVMKAVQKLVADLQKAEETRLRPDCEMCFVGDLDRAAAAEALFEKMRVGRLNAETFSGEPPTQYGALVRDGWRAHHLEVLALEGLAPPTRPLPPSARTSEPTTLPTSPIAASRRPASTKGRPRRDERRPRGA